MQSKMLSLVTLLVVALAASSKLTSAHEEHMEVANKQVTLRDVCSNRQVPIISVQEARRLINDLKQHPELCPNNYVQSFFELEPLLVLDTNERLCSESKFDQIKAYHFRYVNPLVETYKLGDDMDNLDRKIVRRPLTADKIDYTVQLDDFKQEILIPISLQQFFKAWALQVSGLCKRTFVDNLEKAQQLLTDADFDLMYHLTGSTSDSATPSDLKDPFDGTPITPDQLTFSQLVYMPQIEGEVNEGDAELNSQVTILDLRSEPELNRLMHACRSRFKPIYSKLVLPIVRLTKLGYEYVGPKLDDIDEKLNGAADVRRWLMLTRVCESRGNFELVESEGEVASELARQLEYDPMYNYRVEGELWIKGAEALARELDRANGFNSKGFKKFLYNSGVVGRKLVAAIDPHQFAWYRRNQNTLSSSLNIASIMSNTVSMIAGRR